MRCLNAPPVLNSLEAKVVESVPADARHVLVINAGDGRLPRAIRAKRGNEIALSVVTLHPELREYLDDFPGSAAAAWNLDWHAERVAAHGPFDCIVLYQLQEFWRGELHRFIRLLRLAKPGALIWASFFNAQAIRLVARRLPPLRLGFSSLADPFRTSAEIDYASFVDLLGRLGARVTDLWGMLDQNAQDFCRKVPAQPAEWIVGGLKVSIGGIADAFLWGASAVGVGFRMPGGPGTGAGPSISFSPYSAHLLQALLLPYPEVQTREGVLAAADLEVAAWRKSPAQELSPVAKFFLGQLGEADRPKRVLLVGAGWGRDLLLLKRHYPAWDWVGYDHSPALAALAQDELKAEGLLLATSAYGEPLPFPDASFDLAVSLGYFSSLYEPAARQLAREIRRVTSGALYHLEDGRGPDHGLHLKSYSLKAVYSEHGLESTVQPVLVDGSPIGMYLLKVAAST